MQMRAPQLPTPNPKGIRQKTPEVSEVALHDDHGSFMIMDILGFNHGFNVRNAQYHTRHIQNPTLICYMCRGIYVGCAMGIYMYNRMYMLQHIKYHILHITSGLFAGYISGPIGGAGTFHKRYFYCSGNASHEGRRGFTLNEHAFDINIAANATSLSAKRQTSKLKLLVKHLMTPALTTPAGSMNSISTTQLLLSNLLLASSRLVFTTLGRSTLSLPLLSAKMIST